jgi:hypothetical protein
MKAADSLQPQERKPTILVVDDNKTVLEFLFVASFQTWAFGHRHVER